MSSLLSTHISSSLDYLDAEYLELLRLPIDVLLTSSTLFMKLNSTSSNSISGACFSSLLGILPFTIVGAKDSDSDFLEAIDDFFS